jgi:hypothetical protein
LVAVQKNENEEEVLDIEEKEGSGRAKSEKYIEAEMSATERV